MSELRPSFLWLPLGLLFAAAVGYGAYRFQSGSGREALALDNHARVEIGQRPTPAPAPQREIETAGLGFTGAPRNAAASERQAALDGELRARFEALISTALAEVERVPKAKRSECAVSYRVIDLASGLTIAERDPDLSLESASNMKLLTSLAALWMLGPDWHYETHADAVGKLAGGLLEGDLVLRASGDPFCRWGQPAQAVELVDSLAQGVAESGLKRVRGDLVIDRSPFLEPAPAAGWPNPKLYWTKSYALAGGLSLNAGLVSVQVEPSPAGSLARVRLVPGPTGLSESFALASDASKTNDVRIGLFVEKNRLEVSGRYGASLPPYQTEFSHPRPELYFAAVLREQLRQVGIEVEGELRAVSGAGLGTRLFTHRQPWIEHLAAINTDSANSLADGLLMTLGAQHFSEGTRGAGARAVAAVLSERGLPTEGLVQVDGSGLSRDNRTTTRILSEALCAVRALPAGQRSAFEESLAVAGESGTLDDRMRSGPAKGRVRAKTGWISGASSLSGFVSTLSGRELAFSILVSYPRIDGLNTRAWKPMQDRMCEALVNWAGPR
jgi:D-alanyl-D-alanine carboxypeptidase/D-alanyl-D-alanine-endopeptidase (penicillin-binding protein 4)